MKIPKTTELFDLSHTAARTFFETALYPHELLACIPEIVREIASARADEYEEIAPSVFIARDATVSPLATVEGPTVIGHRTEVRPGAFIRGSAVIGDGCVIGNSTEIKNAILFDGAQVPHYNYVGDSILGYRAHMGAGSICSNYRADHATVTLRADDEKIESGRRKLGAIIGDLCEVGCGAVLCPGTILGRESNVYPLSLVRGTVPAASIHKNSGEITEKRK